MTAYLDFAFKKIALFAVLLACAMAIQLSSRQTMRLPTAPEQYEGYGPRTLEKLQWEIRKNSQRP